MKLPLVYYGNPILRKKGEQITEITEEIKTLIQDMIETMHESKGVGLAAPQINKSYALFIACGTDEKDEWDLNKVRVFINPKILSYSQETQLCEEGCLSIPKVYGKVQRPVSIVIRALDENGNEFTEEFKNSAADVILHENDHINGVLFIDRVNAKTRKDIEPFLREIKKKYAKK